MGIIVSIILSHFVLGIIAVFLKMYNEHSVNKEFYISQLTTVIYLGIVTFVVELCWCFSGIVLNMRNTFRAHTVSNPFYKRASKHDFRDTINVRIL